MSRPLTKTKYGVTLSLILMGNWRKSADVAPETKHEIYEKQLAYEDFAM